MKQTEPKPYLGPCGACACLFYTGMNFYEHTCGRPGPSVVITVEPFRVGPVRAIKGS